METQFNFYANQPRRGEDDPVSDENAEVQEAIHEFHQYLSDQTAPLLAQGAMSLLLSYPPALMASAIQSWSKGQIGVQKDAVPASDYLFHALWKVHAFGELNLVDKGVLKQFLRDLSEAVLNVCPATDRELLRSNIGGLGEYRGEGTQSAVELLHRQARSDAVAGPAARPASDASPETARELRRLELLLSRLSQPMSSSEPPGTGESPGAQSARRRRDLITELVATAAACASNGNELEQHLKKIRQVGAPAEMGELFNALSETLPGWSLPADDGSPGQTTPLPSSSALDAMRKLVSLTTDSSESSARFRDMVHSGIKQFNDGVLARAAAIFGLAERLASEKTVSPSAIEAIQRTAHERLDGERLRKLAESPDKHILLRRVLMFFERLSPAGLLEDLSSEQGRDRRRLLLALMEVHGKAARSACLARLAEVVSGGAEPDAHFVRDLIHVLRSVPPAEDDPLEHEIELVSSISPQDDEELVMEAIGFLGEKKHPEAVAALVNYLRSLEEMLLGGVCESPEQKRRVATLLTRTVSTLARMGLREATVAALDHGLKNEPELGDTRARLVALGAQDLSEYPGLVSKVLEDLRAALPKKFIGRFVKMNEDAVLHLITAISGTPTAEVKSTLKDVAERFSDKKFGHAARKAVSAFAEKAPPQKPSPGILGDLELFGLPNLLQSLAGVDANGVLTLFDRAENIVSTIHFLKGQLDRCQTGPLRREAAVYQLFEKPFPGSFAFRSGNDGEPAQNDGSRLEVMGLIMEGVRRYDEFLRASTLVPDDAVLTSAGTAASPFKDEPNEALVESVWERVASGATPSQLDQEFPVDSYRVRRLLAHWVETGSLCLTPAREG